MKKTLQACILSALSVLGMFALVCFPISNVYAQPINDQCTTPTLISSTPGACAGGTPGTLSLATYTAIPNACGASGGNRNDVWYSFVAASNSPTITLSGAITANSPCIQLYRDCAGTQAPAPNCVTPGASITAAGLIPGNTYLIRVYSNTNAGSGFSICITDPTNDLCGAAITLTSTTALVNVPGNFNGATLTGLSYTASPNANCVPGGIARDVWYRFVAQTTNPTVTFRGIGAWTLNNIGIQIVSNNCGSNFTPFYCGTQSAGVATINADFLTPGTTYMIRVYSTAGGAPTVATGAYTISIQDPVEPVPSNDECVNAVNINIMNFCNSIPGDMAGATMSATPLAGSCVGPNAYDVWYKFTAVNSIATVNINNPGANFQNPRVEMFSGTCGSLTSIACGTSPLTNSSLTAGTTYYIRVYSTTPPPPNGNARFDICLTSTAVPQVRYGNSYVNLSKRTTGGVVQPGDTLEIRFFIQYSGGVAKTNARFVDNVPTKTAMLATTADSIRIITNEGLMYKKYTPAAGDDAATYKAVPGGSEFNIRVNLGFGSSNPGVPANNTATETASATGTMARNNRPTLFGSSVIFAVAYRVRVTGAVGDTIVLNPAQFRYMTGGANDTTLTATSYKILITDPLTLCTNSIGLNNAAEFGGSFGSGTTPNRPTDLNTPIAGYSFVNDISAYNSLGDGRYAIIKNISPRNRTNKLANFARSCPVLPYGDPLHCNNRMHGGHWYIDGDHTGTNNAAGNAPPAINASAGYMLEVNADYVPSEIYSQTLNNLCPNTYYEFSAWFRNICPTCGADSTGGQFAGTPTAPTGGYPGVLPNLCFSLDGLDYYNTGAIDTVGWVKKGFVFRTGLTQTSATFSIRNNAQGGGGNDWVMDDIAVATCLPTMSYSPTINPNVCRGNAITIADTISSFFRNYTTFKWQKSTNGGASWTDITGVTTLPDTNYYITTFTVPPASTTMADSGTLYRVVVATTVSNLTDPNCNISDGVTITLSVNDCGIPLKTDLLSFNGRLVADKGNLSWTTSREEGPVTFRVERSSDGSNYSLVGTVNGRNNNSAENNSYTFIDPQPVNGKVYYRLIMVDPAGSKKYSRTITLNKQDSDQFALVSVVNPFNYSLDFDVSSPAETKIETMLVDLYGKVIQKKTYLVHAGVNALSIPNTENLPAGTYVLRIKNNETVINRKVLKKAF